MRRKIAVVGSINMDYFIECDQFPKDGETILGKNLFISVGGKGANQAVAAGLSVTKKGAQTGMPSIDEVAQIVKEG